MSAQSPLTPDCLYNCVSRVRVGTRLLLLFLLGNWMSPAALAAYTSAQPPCCRRAGHHCPTGPGFRDARLHCHTCQPLLTAHQAPRTSAVIVGIATHDDHPVVHEFSSAFSSADTPRSHSQRAPPASPSH